MAGLAGIVVVVVVVVAFGGAGVSLVSAQSSCASNYVVVYFSTECLWYINVPSVLAPGQYCCDRLRSMQNDYGSSCYCDMFVAARDPTATQLAMARACALPRDCGVAADMSSCPCSATPSPPPPLVYGTPTTPSSYVPASTTSSSGNSSGGKSSSIALPIGASVGGIAVLGLLIYLIVSKRRCCYWSPKPAESEKPVSEKPDVDDGDKVPAPTPVHGDRV